jgi:uncharacterized membrane protein YphA (DoxX/SURF4 family)
LIRIVIGSYFMAISLGLIQGIDKSALFAPIVGLQMGDLVGATVLFAITTAFMSGLYLRVTALMLALFILTASIIQTFMPFQPQNISAFWRDLTFCCAVMLSYSCLKPKEMRLAAVIGRRNVPRVVKNSTVVTPRRVTPSGAAKPETSYERAFQPLVAPATKPKIKPGRRDTQSPEAEISLRRANDKEPQASPSGNDTDTQSLQSRLTRRDRKRRAGRTPMAHATLKDMPDEDVVNIFTDG